MGVWCVELTSAHGTGGWLALVELCAGPGFETADVEGVLADCVGGTNALRWVPIQADTAWFDFHRGDNPESDGREFPAVHPDSSLLQRLSKTEEIVLHEGIYALVIKVHLK